MKHVLAIAFVLLLAATSRSGEQWIEFEGTTGPGVGKHIVLVSGDEEYRSEEALPQLAKILATHHGFRCTVLFAIDPASGTIQPNQHEHLPGLEKLADADLMIIATRFRTPDDASMQAIDDYLKRGGPVIGMRTSTHAFQFPKKAIWARYGNGYSGDEREWAGGFGRVVIGEQWVNHHGHHKHEGTRGQFAPAADDSPIMRGVADGQVWGSTDVYGVKLPMAASVTPLLFGESTARQGDYDEADLHYGLRPTDPAAEGAKNDVNMPIAWTNTYQLPDGKPGRVFATTMGSSADLTNPALRRMIVNAAYWATGLAEKIPADGTNVEIVGVYNPTKFGFQNNEHWQKSAMTPNDFE